MLKPYMGYSRYLGSSEGAVLIFAHTAKEARVLMYRDWANIISDGWLDTAIKYMSGEPWLFAYADQVKLEHDEPHIIDNPPSCNQCGMWGNELNSDNICYVCIDSED